MDKLLKLLQAMKIWRNVDLSWWVHVFQIQYIELVHNFSISIPLVTWSHTRLSMAWLSGTGQKHCTATYSDA